jgi:hypothetical protein
MRVSLSLLAAAALLFALPELRADIAINVIPPTGGGIACGECLDPNYFNVDPVTLQPVGYGAPTVVTSTINGAAPGGWVVDTQSGAQWDASAGDVGVVEGCGFGPLDLCPTFVWGVDFNSPVAQNIVLSGYFAANGPVSVSVDGLGGFLGVGSINTEIQFPSGAQALGFAVNAGENELDFIFSGCNVPSPTGCFGTDEPISALLIDPTFTTAPPGTPIASIPEAQLVAAGGAQVAPEPGYYGVLAVCIAGLLFAARRRKAATDPARPTAPR